MAATAPANSWSGFIMRRKMHTTKQLVSSSSPARLPQSVANPQDPYIQMSKVLQTDGSNRACNLMVWSHQATQDAYTKQLVSSSSPARLPQAVANPQDPYIQMSKVLQTDGSNRACNLMVWSHQATKDAYYQAASQLVFTCTVAAICLQILKIHTFKCQRSCKQTAATAPANSWSGFIMRRKMHTTKQLVSSSSPARLPQSVVNPQDPYIQMPEVLQTDGSNRAYNLMIWRHQATQDAYHQAASQLVFTCTVAAICCKSSRSIHSNVKGLANRWQQPRLQPHDLASSSDARCIPPSS